MPGTTRYSATFDRTYEEEDRVDPAPLTNARRSRSLSLQAISGLDGRPYTPLGGRPPTQRSSSTDSGPSKGPEHIPTRTVGKTAVKAHNNPFQFVKVGTCPLYKKAEEQLKKTKEVKKPDVLKEEEEEWQSNLDSWKSRRRKMSEDVFRRQEEIKQFEQEEQNAQVSQKKTKTFSEMVESRAHRGRTLSLCLISSPLEFQDWEFENKNHKNGSCSTFTDESEENSTVNSEDEGVSLRGRIGRPSHKDNQNNNRTNGDVHIEQNGSKLDTHNGDYDKLSDLTSSNAQMKPKEGSYIDSGLESISSSHRAGDTPDSGSDFSQDSNSSIDCESPRTGVNILEEFSSKSLQMSPGQEIAAKLNVNGKAEEFGFTFLGGKDAGQVLIASVLEGSKAASSGIQLGDQIITIDGKDVSSKKHAEIASMVQKGREKGEINLLLWRHNKSVNGFNSDEKPVDSPVKLNKTENHNAKSKSQQYEKSIESENEMYVDDFDELRKQSELLTSSNESETTCTNSQAQSNGNISPTIVISNKDALKTSENSSAPKLKENIPNGAVDEPNKTEQKTNLEPNTENQKKNIIKVKRVRKKGVYALDVSGTTNPIPQEGISMNSLFPLSPVTELPSPAEESKTMSSTLSSNPTTPVSKCQHRFLPRETLKEAEVKLNSPPIKESIKTAASATKSANSETSNELKNSSSNKIESKTDSTNVPSSPTVTKNMDLNITFESSQSEKPKVASSPKKVKVKVKKANTLEQISSDVSQVAKETSASSVAQTSDLSVKKLAAEGQSKKEQKSSCVTDDKQVKPMNKNENKESSQKRENNFLSSDTATVTPDALSSDLKDKTSAISVAISSDKTRNLSLKIDAKNESMNLPSVVNTKQPKTPQDEKSKPSFVQKKEKMKLKGKTAEKISPDPSEMAKESSSSSVLSSSSAKNIAKEDETKKEQKPASLSDEKAIKILNKNENAETTQLRENDVPSWIAAVVSDVKSTNSKDKASVDRDSSSLKTQNLSLKINAPNDSINLATPPIASPKQPKTPSDEKSKPSFSPKKEKTKSKENTVQSADSTVLTPEAKSVGAKDIFIVTNTATSPETSRNLSLKIDAQNESMNIPKTPPVAEATKQPKTPQEEKAKPSFARKRERSKSKGKTTEQISPDPSQVVKEVFTTSVSCSSPSESLPKENQPKNEQKSGSLAVKAAVKLLDTNESADSSQTMENIILSEDKFIDSKDKTLLGNSAISSDTTGNISLKIDAQNESVNMAKTPPVSNSKQPKTPQEEKSKPSFARKRERSKSKEKNVLTSGTNTVTPESKSDDSKSKTLITNIVTSPDKKGNLSLKIGASNEPLNIATIPPATNTKPPKTPQDEKSKPAFVQKREKSKENNVLTSGTATMVSETMSDDSKEKIAIMSSAASFDKTRNLSLKIDIQNESLNTAITPPVTNTKQPKTPQDEKSKPSFVRKRERSKSKENNVLTSEMSTGVSETISDDSKEKIAIKVTATSSDKPQNLSIKIDTQNESLNIATTPPVSNTKPPKTPQDEKSKPSFVRKRERKNSKENNVLTSEIGTLVSETLSEDLKEKSMIMSTVTSYDKNKNPSNESLNIATTPPIASTNQPKTPQEEKSKPSFVRKRERSKPKENNLLTSEISTVVSETISDGSKEKIAIKGTATSSDKPKNLSIKIDTQNESLNIATSPPVSNTKPPKTPQDEKSKPSFVRKRERKNSKENNVLTSEIATLVSETLPKDSKEKIMITSTGTSSGKNKNLSVSTDIQNESLNMATTPPIAISKQPKTPQDEKSKPSFVRKRERSKSKENNVLTSEITTVVSEAVSDDSKDKIAINSTTTSSDKTKNLAVKIEIQNESLSTATTPPVTNTKQPETPLEEKSKPSFARKRQRSKSNENIVLTSETATVVLETISDDSKGKIAITNAATSSDKTSDLSVKIDTQNGTLNVATSPVGNTKLPKDEKSKPSLSRKRETLKSKENNVLTSETTTVLSETMSEDSKDNIAIISTAPSSDKSRNLSIKIDAQNESTTSPIANTKQPKTPQEEKSKPPFAQKKDRSKSKEKNVLTAETTVIPEPKSDDSNDKTLITNTAMSSDKTKNLSINIDAQKESLNIVTTPPVESTKQPKTPQDEKSKPFARKRERSKSKGKIMEQISLDPSQVVTEASTGCLSCTSPAKNLDKESQPKKEQKSESVANEMPGKMIHKSENPESLLRMENGIKSAETAAVTPDKKIISSSNPNLSLKIDAAIESVTKPVTPTCLNTVEPKTPQDEKSKPFARKRARSKSKGKITEQISSDPSQVGKETSTGSLSCTSPANNLDKGSQLKKEEKSESVANEMPGNMIHKSGNPESLLRMENGIKSTETAAVAPDKKSISSNVPNQSLKIDANIESVNMPVTPTSSNIVEPKTPQDEKSKPFTRKRTRSKSKGKITEQISSDPSQVAKEASTGSVSCTSTTKYLDKESQPKKEQKLKSVANEMPGKMINKSENAESLLTMEKGISAETATVTPDKKTISSKDPSQSLKMDTTIESVNIPVTPTGLNIVQPKTPQDDKSKPTFSQKNDKIKAKENSVQSAGTVTVVPDTKSTALKDKISISNTATSSKTRNLSLKLDAQNESVNLATSTSAANQSKTPQDEKLKPFAQKEKTKPKEKVYLSLATSAVCDYIEKYESQKSSSATVPSCNVVNGNSSLTSSEKNTTCNVSSEASSAKSDVTKPSVNCEEEKSKPPSPKKTRNRTKKKNTNSQKVNTSAKQNEDIMISNTDSLNIVFQSESKNTYSENQSVNVKNSENNCNKTAASVDLVPDILPVEKVAEEMEKLILEQLEEEERAKELASGSQTKNTVGSPEHLLTAPPRLAEPPKEKPPPPPSSTSEGNQKDSSLKRVNSTKRIKKEIHKRRSNFLGIDNADENTACNEPSIPPPPALEEILKAEMELDRQSRLKIESASTERLTMEEKEIMQKEREIIESLESEERQKQLLNDSEDLKNVISTTPTEVVSEEERILSLKHERKRIESERFLTEEQQQLHLLEEKQLREREEFIRKQEALKSAEPHSDPSLSVAANASNTSQPALSSSLTETQSKVSLSGTYGDGKSLTSNSTENKSSECDEKEKVSQKPAVPPKPLKKKEAIRKERERLRQEQEALQREREEHRQKLMLEQEELMKHQKSHAPDAPVSRLGPLPPLVQPNFPPQLTTTINATPNARESASFPSRSHHGTPNVAAGSINAVELMGPPVVRQNRMPASRKAVQNEAWGQQKMPSVRKQNHDSLTESRYNQNHWLIQEAEMRRITELKERQRAVQLPCSQTHLAEDDVCSNPPRVPVITPTHNPHLSYAVHDKMWNYGQSNMPKKKYPPPVIKDPLHAVYPRETVSQQPPTKPSRVVPMERQEQMLSVSGRKRCSHCNEELGRGAAMIIESLQLYYHIHCFQCCVCQAQLGNGSCGTDVRVRNNKLHCHNCYSNDEAGLKFSQV